MILREALGEVQRFVADFPSLSKELQQRPGALGSWAELSEYLSELYAAIDALDKATGDPRERGGPIFEFYDRGLARIREYARTH